MSAARLLLGTVLAIGTSAGFALPAIGAESATIASARAVASLVSDTDAVAAGHGFRVALRLRIAPGWHTYWRNPGDAGAAPDLAWTMPEGVTAGPIAWPAPKRMQEGPLTTFGYNGEVLLPVTMDAARLQSGVPVTIAAHASWLVCSTICVPEEGDLRLNLPAGLPSPSPQAALFARADAAIPRPLPWAATVAPDGTLTLTGPELSRQLVRSAVFIPDGWGVVAAASPPAEIGDGMVSIPLKPGADFRPGVPLGGVLSVTDASGLASSYVVSATPSAAQAHSGGIWRALGLAFLGGLILNLMPCVFPILAMKAMGLARIAGGHRRETRLHGLSYTAGVLVCFTILASALMALRAGGAAVGWGFQFQSIGFVATMAWVTLAVGLNFAGAFSFGSVVTGGRVWNGQAGSFMTGLLAVLVATPCTAPYMAVAIGTALAAPPAQAILVFISLGLGLAAPFLAMSFMPGLARVLPKPGRWMEVLRQVLAFPMFAASAWLMWVASEEAGPDGVLLTASGAVLTGFAAWTFRAGGEARGARRTVWRAAPCAAVIGLVALLASATVSPAPLARNDADSFTPEKLAALRSAGRPVFVNMTAAWCVTCLVNERVALSSGEVKRAFDDHRVAYLKGDWTRQDPEISAFLRTHERDGVPLYVYYPNAGRPPEVLPQILTPAAIVAAIGAG